MLLDPFEVASTSLAEAIYFMWLYGDQPYPSLQWAQYPYPYWVNVLVDIIFDPVSVTVDNQYCYLHLQDWFIMSPATNYDCSRLDISSSSMYEYIPTWIIWICIWLNIILVLDLENIFSIIYIYRFWNIMWCGNIEIYL